ncbi:MAG: ribosome recycling factor [Halobacteriovoraceae bacterium]|nr:ribosome recycling factor [Halobacteriovoraceae bacterium]
MIDAIKKTLNGEMDKTLKSLSNHLSKVRTGRASPSVLDGVLVDYYGTPTPVKQVGQMSTPEARLLQIQPFDKSMIAEIEKSIINANLGVTPSNDGNLIRIPFPALTEDKRKDLVKVVKKHGEDAKIALRNIRRDQNDIVKKSEKSKEISEDDSKRFQDEIQKVTDSFVAKVDDIVSNKEKELMTI